MRKTLTTSVAALSLMLALAGCSGAGVDSVELSNDPASGTAPSVTFETPLNAEEAGAKELREGEGAEIAEGDTILLQAALFKGSDGTSIGETYSQGAGQVLTLEQGLQESIPEMYDALVGAKEGAIIAYSSPETSGAAGDDSTSVEVYEVVRKISTEIEGEPQDSPKGLPEVTENDEGVPTVAKPEGDAPEKLVSEYLIEGDGEEVAEGDTVIANYVGVKWSDGETFDSSYEKGAPASFPLDNVIEGWQEGLAGKKAGSRVILSVPVEQAYGTEKDLGEDSEYPAGDLLFVVDILAAVDTPEAPAEAEPSAAPSASPSATEE
ncbi:peptidylprolyl isomerase [Kocuria sediminis]|uniref:peptidylprolyl isomerase n=1 Tax=Kocuria sediminis TaxID=1038857 RepID=A0A6N8GHU8_9MICC|nr:peptidylprolyl isomerase [Kocuria sediminis]